MSSNLGKPWSSLNAPPAQPNPNSTYVSTDRIRKAGEFSDDMMVFTTHRYYHKSHYCFKHDALGIQADVYDEAARVGSMFLRIHYYDKEGAHHTYLIPWDKVRRVSVSDVLRDVDGVQLFIPMKELNRFEVR